ncbi:MAG TPA: hypothetical protein VHA52_00100, partial [Candidatus Babeliaceae bacterium]|nr:hypothetical protein [Candidatus Babeliaceae bacterium]
MTKEKLGIISSYNELCGNASYTKVLVDELSKYYEVVVVPLNVELLRKKNSFAAEEHIKKVCEQLKTLDCVNIQFEAGLFGSDIRLIWRRFRAIGESCKKLVLTMHRYHGKEKYPGVKLLIRSLLRKELKKRSMEIQLAYSNNRYVPLYNKVVKFCKKRNAPIIVHTAKERDLIQSICKYEQVYDHPLCFFDHSVLEEIKNKQTRKEFCSQFNLVENKIYIGIFGFISAYKGYETIIRAMQFLPKHYELLIFGAQHPHTINLNEKINPYIGDLLELIAQKKLSSRIKFYGSLNDEEFLRALIFCDYNVLPYLEVNQGGSAIAALTLEIGAHSIFSQNRAFM